MNNETRENNGSTDMQLLPALINSNALLSFGIALATLTITGDDLRFWSRENAWIILPFKSVLILSIILILGPLYLKLREKDPQKRPFIPSAHCGALILFILFFCNWLERDYNLFQGPSIRGEIILGGLTGAFLLLKTQLTTLKKVLFFFLPITMSVLGYYFFMASGGQTLFADDNSVFIYRLSLLKQFFPHIPFYFPLWNAGIDMRDFFASGSLNIFLFFSPLWYLLPVAQSYNLVIGLLLFFFLPLSVFASAKLLRSSDAAASIAGVLGLCLSLMSYRWALKYGTLGFTFSAACMPLAFALIAKMLLTPQEFSARYGVIAVVIISLMLCWSPSGLIFLPLVPFGLIKLPQLLKAKVCCSVLIALLVFNLPWMAVFVSVSKVSHFVKAEAPLDRSTQQVLTTTHAQQTFRHKSLGLSPTKSLEVIRTTANATNPLVLIFGILGLWVLPKSSRLYAQLIALWLLFLGSVMVPIKPQLEFDRMLILLGLFLTIPAGILIEHLIISSQAQKTLWLIPSALCLGFLFTSPFSTAAVVSNRTIEQFSFTPPLVPRMINLIKSLDSRGRILFSGFSLHELGSGHLAPLAVFTGKAMMASSYVHNLWSYKQPIPKSFMDREDAGVQEYLDLYNVEYVFAHEPFWRQFFLRQSQSFQEIAKEPPYTLFKRTQFPKSYFLEGSGEIVSQTDNELILIPKSSDLTLRFTYFPFLQSSSCDIDPISVAEDITFIRLTHCDPGEKVVISARSAAWRVFHG